MLDESIKAVGGPGKLAVHFHDTYGQALANVLVAVEVTVSPKYPIQEEVSRRESVWLTAVLLDWEGVPMRREQRET